MPGVHEKVTLVVPSILPGMGVMIAGSTGMPVPLTAIDYVVPVTFSALSVRVTFSFSEPTWSLGSGPTATYVGVKLMGRSHCPAGLRLVELVQAFASPAP